MNNLINNTTNKMDSKVETPPMQNGDILEELFNQDAVYINNKNKHFNIFLSSNTTKNANNTTNNIINNIMNTFKNLNLGIAKFAASHTMVFIAGFVIAGGATVFVAAQNLAPDNYKPQNLIKTIINRDAVTGKPVVTDKTKKPLEIVSFDELNFPIDPTTKQPFNGGKRKMFLDNLEEYGARVKVSAFKSKIFLDEKGRITEVVTANENYRFPYDVNIKIEESLFPNDFASALKGDPIVEISGVFELSRDSRFEMDFKALTIDKATIIGNADTSPKTLSILEREINIENFSYKLEKYPISENKDNIIKHILTDKSDSKKQIIITEFETGVRSLTGGGHVSIIGSEGEVKKLGTGVGILEYTEEVKNKVSMWFTNYASVDKQDVIPALEGKVLYGELYESEGYVSDNSEIATLQTYTKMAFISSTYEIKQGDKGYDIIKTLLARD